MAAKRDTRFYKEVESMAADAKNSLRTFKMLYSMMDDFATSPEDSVAAEQVLDAINWDPDSVGLLEESVKFLEKISKLVNTKFYIDD